MKKILASLLLCGVFSSALAQSEPAFIDSIIAIVEDDVITNDELSKEVDKLRAEYRQRGRELPASNALNAQVLELMINKSILLQEARRRGVTVTETQLNNTMQNLAKRNNKTLAEFRKALIANGINYKKFREDVRNQMIINTIDNSYTRSNAEISDQEVDDFIQRNGKDTGSLEYKLSHILIALPDGASTKQVQQAKKKAEEVLQKLRDGGDFYTLATEYSASSNALEGGDLGWRKLAEVPSLFAKIVPTMKKGEFSDLLRSSSGFHIVKLDDKRDSEKVIVKQTHARHILIKPDKLTSDDDARQKLEDLRQQIIDGADFAELARKNSDDPGSKGLGGDLGWFSPGTMVPAFEKVLENSKPGDVSDVFRSRYGWHILQVLERKQVDETEESKRKKIRQQLQKQKRAEVLELWHKRLRDEAFVKINAR
jgi:peptidyl-prolyl cis-trans isomerase SurA